MPDGVGPRRARLGLRVYPFFNRGKQLGAGANPQPFRLDAAGWPATHSSTLFCCNINLRHAFMLIQKTLPSKWRSNLARMTRQNQKDSRMRKSSIGTTRRQLALSAAVAALAPSSVGVVTTAQAQDGGILALLGAWRTAAAAVDRVHFEASAYEESGVQVPARLASQSIRLKAQRDAILGRMLECQPTSVAGIAALAEVAASMFGDSVAELDSELERDRARGSVDAETFSIATVIAVLRAVQVGT